MLHLLVRKKLVLPVWEREAQDVVSLMVFLILTRDANVCVYTRNTHSQIFEEDFVRNVLSQ